MSEGTEMISVIIPAYNVERYISRAMDSVLAQTVHALEVIAVDDGSTDGTGEVLDGYADRYPDRVTVLHTSNRGVTAARLTGVDAAHGEWIGFVDGDDEIEPDMYEFLLKNAVKYEADISHCGYQMIFADGRVHYFHNTGCLAQQDRTTGLKDLLDGSLVEPGLWNKLFRKTLFHSLLHDGLMPADIRINEDLLMNYFLFQRSKCSVFEDVCKYHYIVRESSASRSALNEHKIYDPIKVRKLILDEAGDDMKEAAEEAYLNSCLNTYNTLVSEDNPVFRQDRRTVAEILRREKTAFGLLPMKRRVMAAAVIICPDFYRLVYSFYAKHIQKNPYE